MKQAQDFLRDSALGDKSLALGESGEEKIVLSIEEGAVPVSLLKEVSREAKKKATQNLFQRIDEWMRALGKPTARDQATFFRLLSILINAGVPLIKSLDTVSEQSLNVKMREAIFSVARAIEKGATFSDSLQQSTDIFSDAQVGMIRAAEASGQLNQILKQLAVEVEKNAAIKRKVKGALMYPMFILGVMLLVVTGMMVFVVPQIATIFRDSGKELPVLTQIVIGMSDFMIQRWPLLFGGIAVLVVGITTAAKTAMGRRAIDWSVINMPLFGLVVRQSILARFARSLGNLLKSGVPITQGLVINARSLGNEIYREKIELISEDIARGIPLGESMRDSPEFPIMMVQMISVGEQTAQLDTISGKIAEYYEEEVDTVVGSLSKLIEPMLIVLLGGIVGLIVGAIMMPIMQLTQVAG